MNLRGAIRLMEGAPPEDVTMPRYYFDLQAGSHDGADATGSELADESAARAEAVALATQACRTALEAGETCEISLHVREDDRSLFVVEMRGTISPANPQGDSIASNELNSGNDV
jgi:hypothetical protein